MPYVPQTEFGRRFRELADEARREGLKQLTAVEIERELNKVRYGG